MSVGSRQYDAFGGGNVAETSVWEIITLRARESGAWATGRLPSPDPPSFLPGFCHLTVALNGHPSARIAVRAQGERAGTRGAAETPFQSPLVLLPPSAASRAGPMLLSGAEAAV
jgi:hypothetical protein